MQNSFFFPQAALDQWIVDGTVDVDQSKLTIVSEGRSFQLAEAVRVLREVSGSGDAGDLVGRVKARAFLEQLGAELIETSMLLGDAAYDVEPGWIGIPSADDATGSQAARPGHADEELLVRFLAKNP
jgi:hypothetical protein